MFLHEIKKTDIPRSMDGKPLRGLAKELAVRRRKEDLKAKDYEIKDDMVGAAQRCRIKEEALETQNIEDVWEENKDSTAWYTNSMQYQVRQIPGSSPARYEAFSVVGDQRKPFGKFDAVELKASLEPIRAGQKPDVEGFTTYVDPEKVEAFQYEGEPTKVLIDKIGGRLNNGDYVVRSNDGNDFKYAIEKSSTFEATLTKAT